MRLLASILLILISLNLSAKEYSLSSETFNAKIEIGAEDFINNAYFNLDIITSTNVNIELPKDFEEKFYIENFEKRDIEGGRLYRYILILKECEDFILDPIKLSTETDSLSFENIAFRGLSKEIEPPCPSDIILDEEEKWKYYLILFLTLFTSIVFCVKKRKGNIKKLTLDLSDFSEIGDSKAFCEALLKYLNKFLRIKYSFNSSAKSAQEISDFLKSIGFENTASFVENSNEIMYSKNSPALEEDTKKAIMEELERSYKNDI